LEWKEVAVRSTRPVCGRCLEEIVGVVPLWLDKVPVCRNCAYGSSPTGSRTRGEGVGDPVDSSTGNKTRSRIRPGIGILVLITGILVMGIQAGEFVNALEPEKPLYKGASDLDPGIESCISNLWKITRLIQDGALRWPNLVCPATGTPYTIVHEKGNSIVQCPNPGEHQVMGLRVSRSSPVPEVEL